jgi:phage baseplate assembly protein W
VIAAVSFALIVKKNSAVRSAVSSAVDSAVDSAVGSTVRSAVSSAVDSAVGSAVRSAVGSAVSSAVRSAVGSAVSSAVSSAVDSAVDSAVGSTVRSAVDSAVDSAVGSAVRSAGWSFFGAGLWAGYPAWADFFSSVLKIEMDRSYIDLAESCGYWWALDGVVFATERPTKIVIDGLGRSHCVGDHAIKYESGDGINCYKGVVLPHDVWGKDIEISYIEKQKNAEVKRALIEIYGIGKYIVDSGMETIDSFIDRDKNPVNLYMTKEMQFPIIEMTNSTAEPDGTFKKYFLTSTIKTKSALAAIASLAGTDEKNYIPIIES